MGSRYDRGRACASPVHGRMSTEPGQLHRCRSVARVPGLDSTEWDDDTVTPKDFADAGDTVVVEGRYTGSYKESGKPFDAQFCHVWRVSGGKVKGFQQYTDTAQMQEAMKSS